MYPQFLITHPCPDFNGGLRHGWITTYHNCIGCNFSTVLQTLLKGSWAINSMKNSSHHLKNWHWWVDCLDIIQTSNNWLSHWCAPLYYIWYIFYNPLTHWGRVTHICVSKLTIIGSDNGLAPGRRQAFIWTNAGILLVRPLGTNFNEILIGVQTFSFRKMELKMSSAKWRPFLSDSMS